MELPRFLLSIVVSSEKLFRPEPESGKSSSVFSSITLRFFCKSTGLLLAEVAFINPLLSHLTVSLVSNSASFSSIGFSSVDLSAFFSRSDRTMRALTPYSAQARFHRAKNARHESETHKGQEHEYIISVLLKLRQVVAKPD